MKILIVEDDPNLGFILQDQLEDESFEVTRCLDGDEGLKAFLENRFDLCIIDVMLPKLDGFGLVKKIRAQNMHIPIIFVTAKSMKEDKIKGFKTGADDYITKPFSMEELLLRIQAILRRSTNGTMSSFNLDVFSLGNYTYKCNERLLIYNEIEQKLTTRENDILQMLCEHLNEVVTRDDILLRIWGDDSYHNGRSLDVFLNKLRKYLISDTSIELVSVHGKGYKLFVKTD